MHHLPRWIVGAYAASPCHQVWDPHLESQYLTALQKNERIGGLELPFFGEVHKHDSNWLLDNLPVDWDYVLTAIPGTMEQLQRHPTFGLASVDETGRDAALQFAERARLAVRAINEKLGRQAVRAVELHSAPQLGRGAAASDANAFSRSLRELAEHDWQGATLLVEHCDRYVPGQQPAKGFLSLAEEMHAIVESATDVKILINWGRSAIEDRDPNAPQKHLRLAKATGLLGGLIFSGVTQDDPLYGNWSDSHAPFGGSDANPRSLMTPERVMTALQEAQDVPVLGLKIQALPKSLSVDERVALVNGWCRWLDACAG